MASGSRLAVLAALVGNAVIAVLKLTAGLIANSAAMLAEAAHSFSDVGNQLLLLLGIARSKGEPTPEHPFGSGKASFFWPFMVAVLLFGAAGTYSLLEGIEKVRHPHELGSLTLSLSVLGVAFVIEAAVLFLAVRQARAGARKRGIANVRQFLGENRDATLLTVIVEDALALLGLAIAGLALVIAKWTGDPIWDGLGSVLIGVLLMSFSLFLGWEVRRLLIGRGLSARDTKAIQLAARDDPDVEELLQMQSMYLSAEAVLLGAEVRLRDGLDSNGVEAAVARLETALRAAVPQLKYVYLEPRDGRSP